MMIYFLNEKWPNTRRQISFLYNNFTTQIQVTDEICQEKGVVKNSGGYFAVIQ